MPAPARFLSLSPSSGPFAWLRAKSVPEINEPHQSGTAGIGPFTNQLSISFWQSSAVRTGYSVQFRFRPEPGATGGSPYRQFDRGYRSSQLATSKLCGRRRRRSSPPDPRDFSSIDEANATERRAFEITNELRVKNSLVPPCLGFPPLPDGTKSFPEHGHSWIFCSRKPGGFATEGSCSGSGDFALSGACRKHRV